MNRSHKNLSRVRVGGAFRIKRQFAWRGSTSAVVGLKQPKRLQGVEPRPDFPALQGCVRTAGKSDSNPCRIRFFFRALVAIHALELSLNGAISPQTDEARSSFLCPGTAVLRTWNGALWPGALGLASRRVTSLDGQKPSVCLERVHTETRPSKCHLKLPPEGWFQSENRTLL